MAITVTNTAGKLETRIKSFFAQPELTVSMATLTALPLIIDHYHFHSQLTVLLLGCQQLGVSG